MFAHVFPIDHVWVLWNHILNDAHSDFQVHFSVAVLVLVRRTLLATDDFGTIVGFLTRLPLRVSVLVTQGVDVAPRAAQVRPEFAPGFREGFCPEINAGTLVSLLAASSESGASIVPVVVDVRDATAPGMADTRIRGAIAPSDVPSAVSKHKHDNVVWVVVDDEGAREADAAATALAQKGVSCVCTLRGGMVEFEGLDARVVRRFLS